MAKVSGLCEENEGNEEDEAEEEEEEEEEGQDLGMNKILDDGSLNFSYSILAEVRNVKNGQPKPRKGENRPTPVENLRAFLFDP